MTEVQVAQPHLICTGVWREAVIKESRENLLEPLALFHIARDKIDCLLARQDIPDAIARQDDKFIVAIQRELADLGVARHLLLLG